MFLPPFARRVTPVASALLALGAPAWAESPDRAPSVQSWGETTPAFVRLEPAEDHPADLYFVNELTLGNPLQMFFALSVNGLRVDVEVSNGVGDVPDVVTVHPPMGYVAVPESIEVDEGSTGRIAILYALVS
ncbi:hypothetical protein Rumeso_00544 [Rubellimicrobium mesophilum DSM 19309]|uniref:Uncharacterized protein n=1 Tax=Rubellimicrobium mesophilum DSM 19309 TaxID=442562 RepID=A0A017HTH8_9RHOB|nr:hypothetical protein [Rubellimicrobium mesophilum]EYD77817.1 hypothetical protein Rumeso_00544 [Rubellimicrobium mesophilum DSM 19309]